MGVALGAHPLGDHAHAEWHMKVAAANGAILFEPDGHVLSAEIFGQRVRLFAPQGDED